MKTKRRPLAVITVRIPAKHAAKLVWLAEDTATTTAEILRNLVADAVRHVKPPGNAKSCEVLADSEAEHRAWTTTAAKHNLTVGQLAAKLLRRVAERAGVST